MTAATSISARASAGARPNAAYLEGLNPEQRLAVETTEGPVLVLAGAGTGKTRVLTTRIAHILATGRARPNEVLAVTFTNKAAREMKARIGALVGAVAEGMPWLGTFHSVGTRILRRHAELADLRPDFTILDTDDQIRLLRQVIQAEGIDEKRWPARGLASAIDGWKNRALTPDLVPPAEGASFANGKGVKLYRDYQSRLKDLNAVDFGDLLVEVIRLFREQPDVLAQYRRWFRYILVDEYQDTNVAQYQWLKLLAQKADGGPQNVCCVGDDDQSIYGWRGAEVDNILRFENDFPGATVIRLERNYRSTGHILKAASHLIARNESRLGKTLFTDDELGEKVSVQGVWDAEEEARLLGEEIEALQTKGHSLDEIAILVRISAQMREIEERFITMGLPYRVIGGPRFYERMEIRDALAYLRAVANPADDLAFERIFNTPKRGLGDATLQVLHAHARAARTSLQQAARLVVETDELKARPRAMVRELMSAFSRWQGLLEGGTPHAELAQTVLDESGYTQMWQKDRSADAAGRLENLKELLRSMEDFPDLRAFLEHVSLVMEAAEAGGDERVTVMTLHAAKGLEFETVFLPGWEEALFPSQRALDESGQAGLEEERRLAYVGLTRARRRAKVMFSSNRRIHGLWQSTIPSRFVDELPEASVDVVEAQNSYTYGGLGQSRFDRMAPFAQSSYATPGWRRAQAQGGAANEPKRVGLKTIEGELVATSTGGTGAFATGARVFHQKFGGGRVMAVDGNKLTVDFDNAGRKMVIESFLRAG